MMDFNLSEIRDLTMDEIAGIITEEEKEHLYKVITENQEAFILWQNLHQTLGTTGLREAKESIRPNAPQEIIYNTRRKKRKRNLITAFAITTTALLIGLIYVRSLWVIPKKQAGQEVAANSYKGIQLKLATGKVVDLSNDIAKTQIDEITLTSTNKTLHYSTNVAIAGLNTLTVPVGKDYTIALSDGTTIQLNAASSLTFPMQFTGDTREISINGEAYLTVAQQVNKPFIVHLPGSTVRVLGTEFNVNTYDSGVVKVALITGSVKLNTNADSTILKPGYEGMAVHSHSLKITQFDPEMVLSWREGIYEFGQTTLKEVCRILPRWYGINVVMDNETVGNKSFLGSIDRNKPLAKFLDNLLASDVTIQYYYDNNGVLHFR